LLNLAAVALCSGARIDDGVHCIAATVPDMFLIVVSGNPDMLLFDPFARGWAGSLGVEKGSGL